MKTLSLKSYAKVNLFLAVRAKRRDNYHTIQTIFERIGIFDTITFTRRADNRIVISCDDPAVPSDERNLCYRAALLLREKYAPSAGVDIAIAKTLPVGAGLGGGSSNAATALLGLNKLWRLDLSLPRLISCGRKIGADVPFFLYNTPFASGSGRGDVISPLSVPRGIRLWHVIVVPRVHVSTPYIYKKWDESSGLTRPVSNVRLISSLLQKSRLFPLGGSLFNGLEEVTVALYPEVKRCKEYLRLLGAQACLMSGSGPSVFGIVRSKGEAEFVAGRIRAEHPQWRVFPARTV